MDDRRADDEILAAVAAGDEAAFGVLYDRFARPLYALGLRWLRDVEDAEELVNDTLVRAWHHAARYEATRGRVAAWLFAIARHLAADRLRARSRRPPPGGDGLLEPVGELDLEGLAQAWEVATALEQLPPVQRQVLLLAYHDDLSQSTIAEVLGIPLGTVKSRTYHGLRALAAILEPPLRSAGGQVAHGAPATGGRT